MHRRTSVALAALLPLLAFASTASAAPKSKKVCFTPTGEAVGVGVSYFWEDTTRRNERQQEFQNIAGTPLTDLESEELVNDSAIALEAWWLTPMWWDALRVGGGGEWVSDYSLLDADEDDEDAEGGSGSDKKQQGRPRTSHDGEADDDDDDDEDGYSSSNTNSTSFQRNQFHHYYSSNGGHSMPNGGSGTFNGDSPFKLPDREVDLPLTLEELNGGCVKR